MITLSALLINLSGTAIFLIEDTTMTKSFPGWAYLYAGFCVFMYQTLDAVDGK